MWVGMLRMSLYGTKDAATNWQELAAQEMEKIGFKRGVCDPCTYHHPSRHVHAMVHGDDYCSVGQREDIEWSREHLDRRFTLKTTIVGDGAKEEKEARVLNRVIRFTEQGWEFEADQRHAEIIAKEIDMESANIVASAGEDEKPHEVEGNLVELPSCDPS